MQPFDTAVRGEAKSFVDDLRALGGTFGRDLAAAAQALGTSGLARRSVALAPVLLQWLQTAPPETSELLSSMLGKVLADEKILFLRGNQGRAASQPATAFSAASRNSYAQRKPLVDDDNFRLLNAQAPMPAHVLAALRGFFEEVLEFRDALLLLAHEVARNKVVPSASHDGKSVKSFIADTKIKSVIPAVQILVRRLAGRRMLPVSEDQRPRQPAGTGRADS